MRYMLLIYSEASAYGSLSEAERAKVHADYGEYTQRIIESGEFVSGDALQSVDTATTVGFRGGEVTLTDGPFAETKEVLGGYYLLDVKDLDRATALAAELPGVRRNLDRIEVRPIADVSAGMPI